MNNYSIDWLKDNYFMIGIYLLLQIPLLIFDSFWFTGWLYFTIPALPFEIWYFVIFFLWQLFIAALMTIFILGRERTKRRLNYLERCIDEMEKEYLVFGINGKIISKSDDNFMNPDSKNFDPDYEAHNPDNQNFEADIEH